MDSTKFIVNDVFRQNVKEYQTRPVMATTYKPGMESGFMVYFTNKPCKEENVKSYEGMKFFDTEADAWDYIKEDNKQYAEVDGELVEFNVEYDDPEPVLHRIETIIEKKTGCVRFKDDRVFISDEAGLYDFFILHSDVWIIQDSDGNIRLWGRDMEHETFFGKHNDIVYEKSGNAEYIKVVV